MKRIALLLVLLAAGCGKTGNRLGTDITWPPAKGGSGLTPIPDQNFLCNVAGGAANPGPCTRAQGLTLLGITPFADVRNSTLVRAQALLGSAFDTIGGPSFDNAGDFTSTLALSGTTNLNGTFRSGVVAVKVTSAFAGSSARLLTASPPSTFVDNVKTTAWYAVWRAKFATAIDSAAEMEFQVVGVTGNTLYEFGARGATDTTHLVVFVRDGSGATVLNAATSVSTLLDATTWHTFEEWNDLTNLRFAFDGAIVQTVAQASITGGDPSQQEIFVQNGATAANREIDCDYMYTVTAGN